MSDLPKFKEFFVIRYMKKKKMSKSYESFGLYIKKVLSNIPAQSKAELQISSDAVAVLDDILQELLDDLHSAMHSVMDASKLATLTQSVAEAATRLVLPGEIEKAAIQMARKAVDSFEKAAPGTREDTKDRSERADLFMSVARVERALSNLHFSRISPYASVYTAAVLEYVLYEILELASTQTLQQKRLRISPRDVSLAIALDDELKSLIKSDIVAKGGVVPHIQNALLAKKK